MDEIAMLSDETFSTNAKIPDMPAQIPVEFPSMTLQYTALAYSIVIVFEHPAIHRWALP